MYFGNNGNVKARGRYLHKNLINFIKEERCSGGKTKMICSVGKF